MRLEKAISSISLSSFELSISVIPGRLICPSIRNSSSRITGRSEDMSWIARKKEIICLLPQRVRNDYEAHFSSLLFSAEKCHGDPKVQGQVRAILFDGRSPRNFLSDSFEKFSLLFGANSKELISG